MQRSAIVCELSAPAPFLGEGAPIRNEAEFDPLKRGLKRGATVTCQARTENGLAHFAQVVEPWLLLWLKCELALDDRPRINGCLVDICQGADETPLSDPAADCAKDVGLAGHRGRWHR